MYRSAWGRLQVLADRMSLPGTCSSQRFAIHLKAANATPM